jgi:hypothetical protein
MKLGRGLMNRDWLAQVLGLDGAIEFLRGGKGVDVWGWGIPL